MDPTLGGPSVPGGPPPARPAEEASERLALQRHFELGGLTRCWEGAARRRHAVDRQCAEERAGMVSARGDAAVWFGQKWMRLS